MMREERRGRENGRPVMEDEDREEMKYKKKMRMKWRMKWRMSFCSSVFCCLSSSRIRLITASIITDRSVID